MKTKSSFILSLAACLALSACQTTGGNSQMHAASATPAMNAGEEESGKSLGAAERSYNQDPTNELAAVDYARALRESGSPEKAALVLQSFANAKAPASVTLTEFSSIALAQGDSKKAESYAQKAVTKDSQNYKAYHVLGLALEMQALHPEAEAAFRKGLVLWKGNPTTIMNNLALNLASQGFLDESIEILRKAQALSPGRTEIERNIRIVTALQQAARGPTPRPPPKPHAKPVEMPKAAEVTDKTDVKQEAKAETKPKVETKAASKPKT